LVGWLCRFRAQTGSVGKATFFRRLSVAASPGEGSVAMPQLDNVYRGISRKTEENHGKR